MVINEKLNLTMLCDFYELTMSQGYFAKGHKERIAYFDLFFRRCPDGGGFAIAAGLENVQVAASGGAVTVVKADHKQ